MPVVLGQQLEVVLEYDVDETAMLVLDWCRRLQSPTEPNRWNLVNAVRSELEREHVARDIVDEASLRITESWQWLRTEGLLAPSNRQTSDSWEVVTRAGRAVDIAGHVADTRATRLLRNAGLEPSIRARAFPVFRRGQYSAAVFQAFVDVEVGVRIAAGMTEEAHGVAMMREAFKIGGRLDDPTLPTAEREARQALFAGAIGTYKNPASHRIVNVEDPQEAAEAILFANALLRIIQRARIARDRADRGELLQDLAAALLEGGTVVDVGTAVQNRQDARRAGPRGSKAK